MRQKFRHFIVIIRKMHKINNIFTRKVTVTICRKYTGWYNSDVRFPNETGFQQFCLINANRYAYPI